MLRSGLCSTNTLHQGPPQVSCSGHLCTDAWRLLPGLGARLRRAKCCVRQSSEAPCLMKGFDVRTQGQAAGANTRGESVPQLPQQRCDAHGLADHWAQLPADSTLRTGEIPASRVLTDVPGQRVCVSQGPGPHVNQPVEGALLPAAADQDCILHLQDTKRAGSQQG